jgi:hypothetical protein
MYKVQTDENVPVNFHAGEFDVVTEIGVVAAGVSVKKHAPVKLASGNVTLVTEGEDDDETVDGLCGIASTDADAGDELVYYQTGEFFGEALELEAGVTLGVLKPAFRKLSIFLK